MATVVPKMSMVENNGLRADEHQLGGFLCVTAGDGR